MIISLYLDTPKFEEKPMPEKTELVRRLRQTMEEFLTARLAAKTEKLAPDDPTRAQWEEKFSLPVWTVMLA